LPRWDSKASRSSNRSSLIQSVAVVDEFADDEHGAGEAEGAV